MFSYCCVTSTAEESLILHLIRDPRKYILKTRKPSIIDSDLFCPVKIAVDITFAIGQWSYNGCLFARCCFSVWLLKSKETRTPTFPFESFSKEGKFWLIIFSERMWNWFVHFGYGSKFKESECMGVSEMLLKRWVRPEVFFFPDRPPGKTCSEGWEQRIPSLSIGQLKHKVVNYFVQFTSYRQEPLTLFH